MNDWITLNDFESSHNKAVRVRASSIDTLRTFRGGTTLMIHGAYLHVTQTEGQILRMIRQALL